MRRLLAGLIVLGIALFVGGIAVGVLGRSYLEAWAGRPATPAAAPTPQETPRAAGVAGVPTAAPAAIVAPTAPPRPVPTPIPATQDVVVELTESELDAQLGTMLVGQSLGRTPLGDATIQSVNVQLRDRRITLGGNARVGFLTSPFTMAGTATPDPAGRPKVTVTEATLGNVLLPDSARNALGDTLQTQVDGLFAGSSMKVRTIEIADGKMRLIGTNGS